MIKKTLKHLSSILCNDVVSLVEEYAKYPIHPCCNEINSLYEIINDINPCLIHIIRLQRISFMYNETVYTVISDWYNEYEEYCKFVSQYNEEFTMDELVEYKENDHLIRNAEHICLSTQYFTDFEQWVYLESLVIRGIIYKNMTHELWENDQFYDNHNPHTRDPVVRFVNKWIDEVLSF